MSLDPTELLFIDASCLIAAAASPSGGSGYLWSLCEQGLLRFAVSQPVLTEAETNLLRKFPPTALLQHRRQLARASLILAAVPPATHRFPTINAKDEHVVAAALAVGATGVLTLDQPLAGEINGAGLGLIALSPGAFINHVLPRHPAFLG
jgi:predicted nucleic acid-binding protein